MNLYNKLRPYITLSIIILIFILFCVKCDNKVITVIKEPKIISLDSVKIWQKKEAIYIAKLDSFTQVNKVHKAKYLKLKESNRNSIIHHICDTIEVLKYYDNTVANCDSVIQSDSLIIAMDKSIMQIDQSIIHKQSEVISSLQEHDNLQKSINDILKKDIKKQKRSKIAIIFGAIGAVVATVFIVR
jgi:hypothetical protein